MFLDTGVLGILAKSPRKPEVAACHQWLEDCLSSGRTVYLPEISDYELRRELIQNAFLSSIIRLNVLKARLIYLPITTNAILLAADLWAQSRRGGQATSDPRALDGDVILAAQMLSLNLDPNAMIVATTNAKHFRALSFVLSGRILFHERFGGMGNDR